MWDRWAIMAVAGAVALRTAWRGWKVARTGNRLAGTGYGILALVAIGVPVVLWALGESVGR